nr:PREDICTED: chromodomain-helicase-DNA-binding protein 9-like [Lepisosteus oculatus]
MTDPMMDFFDDPSLFVGGLDGLSDEGFAGSGPVSLVDELNLGAEFEPLQVEPLGGGKHPGMAPPPASASSQAGLPFEQQLGQFDVLKGPLPLGQPFSLAEGGAAGGGRNALHPQYHSSPVHQPPQPNGLFPDSSPMWGNQEQSGNVFHQPAPSQSSQLGQQQHQQHHHHHHHHHHHLPQPQYMSSQPGQPPSKGFAEHHDFAYFPSNPQPHAALHRQQAPHAAPHSLQPALDRNGSPYGPVQDALGPARPFPAGRRLGRQFAGPPEDLPAVRQWCFSSGGRVCGFSTVSGFTPRLLGTAAPPDRQLAGLPRHLQLRWEEVENLSGQARKEGRRGAEEEEEVGGGRGREG